MMDNSLQSLRLLYEKNDIFRGEDFKEYKYLPVIRYFQTEGVNTSDVFRDKSYSDSMSYNSDIFKSVMLEIYPIFKNRIISSLYEDMIESGVHYRFEDIFYAYFLKNRYMAIQLLLRLLRERYSEVNCVKAILQIISHYSYDEVGDDFVFPLTALLCHENKAIRKFALKVFDNWSSINTLNVLKGTMKMREKWLDDYKNRIIERIERKDSNAVIIKSYQ